LIYLDDKGILKIYSLESRTGEAHHLFKVREGLETLYKEGIQEGLAGVEPDLNSKAPCPALRRARFYALT
jgi:hypothetical protein